MKISRTPYRISLFGGSTDYESYYSKYGSLLIGFTIDSYCYVATRPISPIFKDNYIIQYSKIERTQNVEDIENNAFRGTLQYLNAKKVEVHFLTDLPSQTGIGSSSSCIVGILNSLQHNRTDKKTLAQQAIYIERKLLKEPGGIQDQIWAAYGGINSIQIDKSGDFFVRPLPVSAQFKEEFKSNLLLFYTGQSRNSFDIAQSHDISSRYKNTIHSLAERGLYGFSREDIPFIGKLLHQSWIAKREISSNISNTKIDKIYRYALENGALGGKLLGSGGSGFMIFVVMNNQEQFINNMKNIGLEHIIYNFDTNGTEMIL